jgi:site-specific recombinase XerD
MNSTSKASHTDPVSASKRKRRAWAVIRETWPKIRKRPLAGGKFVFEIDCRYLDAGGRSAGKRYREATEDAALILAEQKAQSRTNEGKVLISLSTDQQRQAVRAFDVLKAHGVAMDLEDVAKAYLKHVAKTEEPLSVEKLVERFLAHKRKNPKRELSKRHLDDLRLRLDQFCNGRGAGVVGFAERMAHEIGHKEIEAWLMGLPYNRTTRAKYRTHLSALFNFAKQNGIAGENPMERVAAMAAGEPPREILTPAQAEALLKCADPSICAALALGLFAGLRPESEICRLDWSLIHLVQETITDPAGNKVKSYGHIDVRESKGVGGERLVQITPNLYAWLKRARPASGTGPVSVGYDRLNELIKVAAKTAGIERWPHDGMRHSFCSYHFAAYRDEHATMAQSGHRSVSTFRRHYCKPIQQKVAFAYWKIRPTAGVGKIVEPKTLQSPKRKLK